MIVTMRQDLMKFSRFVLILVVAVGTPLFGHAQLVDGVWAVVADKVITYAQVEDATRPIEASLRAQYAAQPDVLDSKYQAAMHDSLELLVERALILHNYESGGYNKLPDSVVDGLVEENIRSRFGDRVTMIKTLQSEGMTLEQYRKELLDRYIESGLRNLNIQKDVIVSPYKIETYYKAHPDQFKVEDQVKLRMIVLSKTSPDETNTLALAREITEKIKGGATFNEMAGVYSQNSSQHPGGEWGWVEHSVLRKELADAAFALNKGQVSAPIDTPDSVYVMFVEDKKSAQVSPLVDVRTSIERTLQTQEQASRSKVWIDGLKKKTYVRYFTS